MGEKDKIEGSVGSRPNHARFWLRVAVLTGVVSAFAVIYLNWGEQLNLHELAKREAQLREFQSQNPVLVFGIAFVVYVAVAALSVPGGATVLSLLYAWYFGFWPALLLVSFSSTLGATLAFLLSRFLFREALQSKFGHRLNTFNSALEREGAFYLFSLRLIPAFPFFIINIVMGLTPIKTATFWWVSQIGMLPGTMVYLFAGSSVPDLNTLAEDGPGNFLPIIIAFAILGLFPLVIKRLMARFRPNVASS